MATERVDALVVFGATGDLAKLETLPALVGLVDRGVLDVPVVGVAKSGWDLGQFRDYAAASLRLNGMDPDAPAAATMLGLLRYVDGDLGDDVTYSAMADAIGAPTAGRCSPWSSPRRSPGGSPRASPAPAQLQLVVRRPHVLDRVCPAPRPVHDLHRRRPRRGLHRAHVRHDTAGYEIKLVRRSRGLRQRKRRPTPHSLVKINNLIRVRFHNSATASVQRFRPRIRTR